MTTGSYRGGVAIRQHRKFSPVQVAYAAAPHGDWTPEQAVDLLEQGYPAGQVAARTGYDVRWLTAQQRRLATR